MRISINLRKAMNSMYGEIEFDLVSGPYKQTFREGWSVIGTDQAPNTNSMKLELINCLFTKRLPELFEMLFRTIELGKIYPNPIPGKVISEKELEAAWEIR